MSIIKTLIFVEKAVCPSFFLSRKAHAVSFLLRRTSPYPVIVEATTYSNKVCIFSYNIRYAQSIHRNCFFHTYGDIYAPLITFMGTWISSKFIIFISNSDSNSTKSKYRQNIYSAFICIKFSGISISLIKLIGMGMFSPFSHVYHPIIILKGDRFINFYFTE